MKKKHALLASLSFGFPLLVGCRSQPPVYPTNVQIPVPDALPKDQTLEPALESPPESGPPR